MSSIEKIINFPNDMPEVFEIKKVISSVDNTPQNIFEYKSITYPMSIIAEIDLKKATVAPLPSEKVCIPVNLSHPFDSIKIQGMPNGVEFAIGQLGVILEGDHKIYLYMMNTQSNQGYLSMDQKEFIDWKKNIGGHFYMEKTPKPYTYFGECTYLVFDRNEITKYTDALYFPIIITINMCNVIESFNQRSIMRIREIDDSNGQLDYDDKYNPLYCSTTLAEMLECAQKQLKQILRRNKCIGCLIPYCNKIQA